MSFLAAIIIVSGSFYCEPPPTHINSQLSNVNQFLQDQQGFLWMSSQVGLFRYDGYDLISWSHEPGNPNSLPENWVTSICEDKQGFLWIATFSEGLCRLDLSSHKLTRFLPTGVKPAGITNLLLDEQGKLWMGLEAGGLATFAHDSLTFAFHQHPEDPLSAILTLKEGREGHLWVGTSDGRLYNFNKAEGSYEQIILPLKVGQNGNPFEIWDSLEYDDGITLFGTSHGLFRYEKQTGGFEPLLIRKSPEGAELFIRTLCKDSQNRIWGGSVREGVFVLEPNLIEVQWIYYRTGVPGDLPYKKVSTIFEDRTGLIWIATMVGGICKYDPKSPHFRHLPTEDHQVRNTYVKAIHKDRAGNLWIGGNEGLDRLRPDSNRFETLQHDPDDPQSLSHNAVRSLEEDEWGNLWIGTIGGGLNYLNVSNGKVRRFVATDETDANTLDSNWIEATYLDQNGGLWVGSNRGVGFMDTTTGAYRTVPTRFSENVSYRVRVRVMEELSPGKLYVGSNFGMSILDMAGGESRLFQREQERTDSLADNVVRAIFRDSRSQIWVGTSGGLGRFNEEQGVFRNFGVRDGLANQVIYCILEDDSRQLWLSTNRGLTRFQPEKETFFNFFVEDGLQGSEFNGGAALKTDDGLLYFGGVNGITVFHTRDIRGNPFVPPVAITELNVFSDTIQIESRNGINKTIELDYRRNFLAFEFSSLDFSEPQKNRYSYYLEGLDTGWSNVDTRRFVNYTNLNPGTYTFHVKGSNNEGLWNDKPASLTIEIKSPFYRTTWFYLVCILVVVTLVLDRFRVLTIRGKLLEDTVRERTSSMHEVNNKLKKSNQALQTAQGQLLQAAHEAGMTEVLNGVVHNLGNILNSVGVTAVSLHKRVDQTRLDNVTRIAHLLVEHRDNLEVFLTQDEKGRTLIPFITRLAEVLEKEKTATQEDIARLTTGITMMKDTIRLQQGYAAGTSFKEKIKLAHVVEDMLVLQKNALQSREINVIKKFEKVPDLLTQRHKLAHIITNLLKNAMDALRDSDQEIKTISISISNTNKEIVTLKISDNGAGIPQDYLDQVFRYGFTTKKAGKGFGLHSCANSMTEMGGNLRVTSRGIGKGATFTLEFRREIPE